MKTLQFKCTLLSDVIINQKSATEGNQQTLDFIPGNAFLGIAASSLYEEKSSESMILFHSGKVRFGDAHPLCKGTRAVRIPASWYYLKGDSDKSKLFVHHGIPKEGLKDNNNPVQIKQCRDGFIVKTGDNLVSAVEIKRNFAIKSAYDSANRRSEDQKMYGYESLEAGSEWCFDVCIDTDAEQYTGKLIGALVGKKRVGRSSTAQYGLVEIEQTKYQTSFKTDNSFQAKDSGKDVPAILLYAESRLIFFDEYGQPTFTPIAQQLGLENGMIDWTKSQIRTFQYAPYNGHRKAYDTDRCGIEKGSVFCITGALIDDKVKTEMDSGIGSYLPEGLGRVLVNPEFLTCYDNSGRANFSIQPKEAILNYPNIEHVENLTSSENDIIAYLINQKELKDSQKKIYLLVNDFVSGKGHAFIGQEKFASQWGTIRSIAMQSQGEKQLYDDLFRQKTNEEKEKKINIKEGYLVHGVAAEKWEGKKLNDLRHFIEKADDSIAVKAVINLAAEMAKKCKEDKR